MFNSSFYSAVLALGLCSGAAALGADDAAPFAHDGRLVRIDGDRIVMQALGREHSHALAKDTVVTLDGKPCRAADLQPGAVIRVTTTTAGGKIASSVEALREHETFAHTVCGRFVSYADQRLLLTDGRGARHSFAVAADAKWWCDGQLCQAEQVKPGMRLRVTTGKSDAAQALVVEALEHQPTFAGASLRGKLVGITGERLRMTIGSEQQEMVSFLAPNAVLNCDGRNCAVADLKAGMPIRVTFQDEKPYSATWIEAFHKNPEFGPR